MIIGTAGHIDHGKSALVTALTGRPVDRLLEEQRRGITIDLNFAPLILPGVPPAGIVDVPGHEDFVRTMVAGASGIDLVLLVVDAAQGPGPQTWEHLAIVEQLRIGKGIPVITKADLVEPDWLDLVRADLVERLGISPVAFEAPVIVSAVTGQGVPELLERLRQAILQSSKPAGSRDGFRMPVDRAFSVAGVGTVLTGTPWSGELRVGDTVQVLPSGKTGRVRSIEAYGSAVTRAVPGQRSAVGVAGLERSAIRRGETLLCERLAWRATSALDAEITLLPDRAPLRRQTRVRVLLGTGEVLARVYPKEGLVRLALESPLVARGGDRFVLRSYSPVTTIGGGRVLDPFPPRRASWPAGLAGGIPERARALVERRPGGISREEIPLLLGLSPEDSDAAVESLRAVRKVGTTLVNAAVVEELIRGALETVRAFHRKNPEAPGLSLETLRRNLRSDSAVVQAVLDSLIGEGQLLSRDGVVALPDFAPRLAGTPELIAAVLAALESAGLEPPTVAELEARIGQAGLLPVLRRMGNEGQAVAVERDRFFSTKSTDRFVAAIREIAQNQPVTPASLRDRLGISRKYLIPLLEWADRSGITRRVGDTRVLM
jgi:selenocysteine-specific elongation factor